DRARSGGVSLEIPLRLVESLPGAVEVGFAVGGTRRAIRSGLTSGGDRGQRQTESHHARASKPVSHRSIREYLTLLRTARQEDRACQADAWSCQERHMNKSRSDRPEH